MLKAPKSGFTLIELLVVIALMGLLVGGIGFSMRGGTGKAIEASQRIAIGMLQNARNQAIMHGTRGRLIINADKADPDKYLRQFGVIYEDSSKTNYWLATGRGELLPSNIRFVPNYGTNNFSHNGTEGKLDGMRLDYPQKKPQKEGSGSEYYYYEFTSSGTFYNSLAAFIVGEGIYNPASSQSDKIDWDRLSLAGFKILKTGGTIQYPEPSLIKGFGDE
jgi:prepilin-type N-terminal cleavage/methylation domain-containing protein